MWALYMMPMGGKTRDGVDAQVQGDLTQREMPMTGAAIYPHRCPP